LFSSASASIGHRAYVGPRCHLGWAVIEDDVLLAAGVHVPSGARTHGIDDVATPIRDQPTVKTPVRIGRGSWIGSAAIVLADVGADAVVAAGAVVTRPIQDRVIAAGVPARVIRHRSGQSSDRVD
jgi:acetyltransferase-like isoleucine patch superfamily enzyme